MKKISFLVLSVIMLLSGILFISGCDSNNPIEPETGNSVINGQVLDNNNVPLTNATVKIGTRTTTTGNDGRYTIGSLPAGSFYVVFSKANFRTDSTQRTVNGNDTVTANFTMALGDVLIYEGLVVHESVNGQSLSGVDLYEGLVVTEDNPIRDIQFKDSNGTQNNFYFRSGHLSLAPLPAGYETTFSEKLGELTKAQFDTLSKRWDVAYREINPDIDFGNNQTEYYNTFTGTLRPYYSFYLIGRYPGQNSGKRVYGLLFIRSLDYNSSTNRYTTTIDIKINRDEKNKFVY